MPIGCVGERKTSEAHPIGDDYPRRTQSEAKFWGPLDRRQTSEAHPCKMSEAHPNRRAHFSYKKDKTLDLKIFSQIGNKVNSKYYHEHPLTCNILIMCTYLINPELTYLLHGLRSVYLSVLDQVRGAFWNFKEHL